MIEPNLAVIDIGGAGYRCNTTANTLSYLEQGKKARLYTYCNIKEDAFDIYGFYDMREKRCFEQLLSVSGVGPKAALSILSSVTPESLAMAIVTDNEKALTAAPGIGKRIAQRILLELKDKIAAEDKAAATGAAVLEPLPKATGEAGKISDAQEALLVLGYSRAEITAELRKLDTENMTVEEIIREVLKGSVK